MSRDPTAPFEARDPFAAGLFPVCVAAHDTGIRFLFDLSTLLLLLDCRPGDRVLDLGAGSGFSSEMLARFGYDVVAVDPDGTALGHNRKRPAYDPTRIDGRVRVVQGVGEALPFPNASFDGVLGMNVVHHLPNVAGAVSELARVLRPGCHAVCSEPGLEHLDTTETQRAIREFGENDRAFDVLAFLRLAREGGFSHAMLSATLHPPLRLVPLEELDLFASGQHPTPTLTPSGVFSHLHRRHAFAMLVREGVRPKTSRYPSQLRCGLEVEGVPVRATPGATLTISGRATNIGDSTWLARPSRFGGYVTVRCKLLSEEGRLITDRLGHAGLDADVAPDESAGFSLTITLPVDVPRATYRLQFDLVSEMVCWFSDVSADGPPTHRIEVE